jgi:hypothetical protein
MSEIIYIKLNVGSRSTTSVKEKIVQLETIIDSLYTSALTNVQNGNIQEYDLDTGQTRNRVKYTKIDEVVSAINAYETLLQRYMNMLMPRVVKLIDDKNFR